MHLKFTNFKLMLLFALLELGDCHFAMRYSVVTGSRDHTLAIWDIRDCSLVRKLEGHTGSIRCVKFDGMLVISGSYDHTVKVWIAETGTCVHTLLGHTNRVYSLEVRTGAALIHELPFFFLLRE